MSRPIRADTADVAQIRRTLLWMSDQTHRVRLRRDGVTRPDRTLKLRTSDFATFTRQMHLERPTDQADVVYPVALELARVGLGSPPSSTGGRRRELN